MARSNDRIQRLMDTVEDVEGLLRRQRVKPVTASMYSEACNSFRRKYQLAQDAVATTVDKVLDTEMVYQFLQGELPQKTRVLYYGLLWQMTWVTSDLPLATASRKGYMKSCQQTPELPMTWEEVLLRCLALLIHALSAGAANALEMALTVCCILLSFDT